MNLLIQTLAAACGTVAFSLLFGAPKRYYAYCALIGGSGWLLYLVAAPLSSPPTATFLATVLVILMSRWFAVRKRCPVTIFLISGIIPLVPGAGIYWAAYYAVTNQLSTALDRGFGALKISVAIVLGIVFVFELPQKLFRVGLKKEEHL
ncbi:MAG: threonine/serine exporter family protein [Lachnospiraceae bacterium]|nr:threonine/serine exporter family protein [Lachnospiraceae bacterium]